MNTIRKTGRVSGRVQGVGFRYFVQRVGNGLGLTGWVKNVDTGHVEFAVQGTPEDVTSFLEQVHRGPTMGRVDELTVNSSDPIRDEHSFIIRYC